MSSIPSSHPTERDPILTNSPKMKHVIEIVDKVASSDVVVLIQGESGTGKELIAKRIHRRSARSNRPLISINCGALQDTLLLSELFGHEKGAFTGALHQKIGLVEVAHRGTLFLDEIGEMGMEAQAKLLRFLQEGEIYRVGGADPIKVDVRVVTATNRNLAEQIEKSLFREDLFYRINTMTLKVPPLRERTEDVPLLLQCFLSAGGPPFQMSPGALELLCRYRWPGNVRELENLVERFKVLSDSDSVQVTDIPENIRAACLSSTEPQADDLSLESVVRRHIFRVLDQFNGNKTRAAQAMGITVKTLYNKLARYQQGQMPPQTVTETSAQLSE